jgi:hypothetical protein
MFRFDHFLRTRSEGELNKRLASIYKLIEKERDNHIFDLDTETTKTWNKDQKKKKN